MSQSITSTSAVSPKILIGPVYTDFAESVSMVNSTFADGLAERVDFIRHTITRRFGIAGMGRFNALNVFYFLQQLGAWFSRLRSHPALAHYAVGSGWNLPKGLVFLRLARLRGARTLGHLHSGDFIEFWQKLSRARKRWALRQMLQLDGLVVLSGKWKERVVREVGLDPERVFVVNNPIEKEFEQSALQFPLARSKPVVLALGVMEKNKGVFDLLEAASRLRQRTSFELILAGPEREPGAHEQIDRTIERLGLRDCVTRLGEVRGPERIELFRRASVLALPSYFENFPLVVLEAAAAGVAIVTTPVGATPEFFEHGRSALFVPAGDVNGLSTALQQLLESEARRAQLATAARQTFLERLSRERIMDALYHVYAAVLEKSPA